jgi:hypothetical protein
MRDIERDFYSDDDGRDADMTPDIEGDERIDASKILKATLGGVAAGALLVTIYEVAHHRLSKKKEQ